MTKWIWNTKHLRFLQGFGREKIYAMYACVLFYFPLKTIIFPFNEDLIPNQQIIEKFFKKTHRFDEI